MAHIVGAITVKDYAEWKRKFDEGSELRRTAGMRSYQIFQVVNEPNKLVIVTEFETPDAAREFLHSDRLREANEMSGVIEMSATHDTSKVLLEVERASV